MHQQVAVFKKHVSFCLAKNYFPVFRNGAFDGLVQPSIDRKPAKSGGKGKKGKRKGKSSSQEGGKPPNLGTLGILPKPQTSQFAKLVVDHITLLVFVLISAYCFDKLDSCIRMSQQRRNDCIFTVQTSIWYPCSGLCSVRYHVLWCNCRRNRKRPRRK